MWQTTCRECHWTSGERSTPEETKVLGIFHEQDTPGHTVILIETAQVTDLSPAKRVA